MIRIVVRTDDASMAANVGGPVHTVMRTFDVEAPQLEEFLRQKLGTFFQRQVIGVELPDNSTP